MQGLRLTAACVLVLCAVGASSAAARVPEAERDDALEVAQARWEPACVDEPEIRFDRLRSDTLGLARWRGMWDIPTEEREDCRIVLNSGRSWDWRRLCTTVVHE